MATQGEAYLVQPLDGPGSGVLVLPSWWGLTPGIKGIVESLADIGYTAMATDLLGKLPKTTIEAQTALREADPDDLAMTVSNSLFSLRPHCADPEAPIAVVGYSMGASLALWLATRRPDHVDAVVAYYGTQNIDFETLRAPVLGHFAESDALVGDDERVEMHARLLLSDKHVEVHEYPGTSGFFAEPDREDTYDESASRLAWERTVEFLERRG